jgi:hypothetical protein
LERSYETASRQGGWKNADRAGRIYRVGMGSVAIGVAVYLVVMVVMLTVLEADPFSTRIFDYAAPIVIVTSLIVSPLVHKLIR